MLKVFIAVILTITSFFSGVKYAIVKPPALNDGGIRVHYAEGASNYMDIYLPEDLSGKKDIVFAVHGGAWALGDQTMFTRYAKRAAGLGFVGVTVDYSKTPDKATARTMVDEIQTALTVLKKELAARGIQTDRMMFFGHSAGAHISLLYAYTRLGECPFPIGYVAALSPPADLTLEAGGKTVIERSRSTLLTLLTGENITDRTIKTDKGRAAVAAVNPIEHVRPGVPPTLIAQGNADEMVPYENALRLFEKLKANGVACELVTMDGQKHFLSRAPQEMQDHLLQRLLKWAELYL